MNLTHQQFYERGSEEVIQSSIQPFYLLNGRASTQCAARSLVFLSISQIHGFRFVWVFLGVDKYFGTDIHTNTPSPIFRLGFAVAVAVAVVVAQGKIGLQRVTKYRNFFEFHAHIFGWGRLEREKRREIKQSNLSGDGKTDEMPAIRY